MWNWRSIRLHLSVVKLCIWMTFSIHLVLFSRHILLCAVIPTFLCEWRIIVTDVSTSAGKSTRCNNCQPPSTHFSFTFVPYHRKKFRFLVMKRESTLCRANTYYHRRCFFSADNNPTEKIKVATCAETPWESANVVGKKGEISFLAILAQWRDSKIRDELFPWLHFFFEIRPTWTISWFASRFIRLWAG